MESEVVVQDGPRKDDRNLYIILTILVASALLLVGILVWHFVGSIDDSGDDAVPLLEDGTPMTEDDIRYFAYVDELNEINDKVDILLKDRPVDTNKIDDIFMDRVDHYIEMGEPDRASSYVRKWVETYLSVGMKESALHALTIANIGGLAPAEQYRRYTTLIDLAKELGRDDLVKEYAPLQAKTKEAYDLDYADSLKAEAEAKALGNDEIELPEGWGNNE